MMKKKLNRKGFTLAELLVVIAILAILIAIAIPVFTNMVADAQLRVNQANIRSVRSAAVAEILTNIGNDDSYGNKMNRGTTDGHGWIATAQVDNNGDVKNLLIYACETTSDYDHNRTDAISLKKAEFWNNTAEWVDLPANPQHSDEFASLKPSEGEDGVYTVRVYITDVHYFHY